MSYPFKLLPLLLLASLLASSSTTISALKRIKSKSTLLTRLKLDQQGGPSSCWDALFELQSCSGEVVLFFLNGETTLGPNCCNAIRTIEHQCWPSMMGSLGITTEESDILRGYCDAAAGSGGSASPPAVSRDNLPRAYPGGSACGFM
ncbi:hypothetical protein DH2020_033664 [Rehmannia glutinosa]|uniref:Prolamin-like domain-containing protein n=1 Tax=Rehmannia glutinosa TaxID=99300 RepID=A0ABR0VCG4_REHGL